MRSNSGLERFQRSSVSHRSLSATSFRADIGFTELLMLRGSEGRSVPPTSLGVSSLAGGDFSSMAQPPFRQDRDRSLSPGRLHSRYYWPMMKTAYTNSK